MSAADWYAHKSLGEGVFWIQERFFDAANRCNIWLIRGSHQDVIIDTGLGLRSLPEYIEMNRLLGDDPQRKNPLLAIATHAHFDHTGGLHQFENVAIHSSEAEAMANGDNYEMVTLLTDKQITESPSPGWKAKDYKVKAVQPTHILQEGDVINLGDRQLSVLHMPGHSRGSICLLDREKKLLFSGDVMYDGPVIDFLPYSHVSDYISTCERLVGLCESEQVDQVLPGHYAAFGAKQLTHLANTYVASAQSCAGKFSTFAKGSLSNMMLRLYYPR
ncbi:metallo-beta-lactamase domain-containing protein 2 [Centropristis striata]|uniref:metallo-beta-lactamase domain-containing protein 2 n=1 Tax=Centropristis striata TaxID=184440 RepID=UPI0027DF1F8F|nr:metallo-beta-lactamase domain-containing protein 2 [Centropristis striata]